MPTLMGLQRREIDNSSPNIHPGELKSSYGVTAEKMYVFLALYLQI